MKRLLFALDPSYNDDDDINIYVFMLISFSGGTFLRGVQGNPNYFPILVQGDAVDGMSPI